MTLRSEGRQWGLRTVPPHLVRRYLDEGWWNDETLGTTVAAAVDRRAGTGFTIHSKVRPWRGTFAEVDAMARSFAASLRARGIGPGDVVAFQLPNWVEAAVTFWGAARVGAVIVPIVHFYGPKEVGYVLDVAQPDLVVTAGRFGSRTYLDDYRDLLGGGAAGDSWFVVGADAEPLPPGAEPFSTLLDAPPLDAPVPTDPDAPAVIGFTSGTTRDPKGVIHSHRTLGCEVQQLDALTRADGPPSIVGTPVGHFMGMLAGLLLPLLRETPIHLIDAWDPGEILRIMDEERIGLAGGATYFVTSVLDHPDVTEEHVARIPHVGMGGATVPPAVTERLTSRGIRVFRSYGSTEHPSITGCTPFEDEEKRLNTDGHPLDGVEVRLDDEGEISSRGPDLFIGYTDPDLTARAFDDDGWYRTGDVGAFDDDGFLTITDRVSDIIIRGGENISALEVEEQLLGLASVAEVAVVAEPDERLGEHTAAVVVARPRSETLTLGHIRAHLAAVGLAKQKWPESLHLVDDLPRTPTGKVQKAKLRQQLRAGDIERPAGPS